MMYTSTLAEKHLSPKTYLSVNQVFLLLCIFNVLEQTVVESPNPFIFDPGHVCIYFTTRQSCCSAAASTAACTALCCNILHSTVLHCTVLSCTAVQQSSLLINTVEIKDKCSGNSIRVSSEGHYNCAVCRVYCVQCSVQCAVCTVQSNVVCTVCSVEQCSVVCTTSVRSAVSPYIPLVKSALCILQDEQFVSQYAAQYAAKYTIYSLQLCSVHSSLFQNDNVFSKYNDILAQDAT